MKTWIPERDLYLDELIRRQGRGDFTAALCAYCQSENPGQAVFRCSDCSPGPLCCDKCLCERHLLLPYHRIKVCTNTAMAFLAEDRAHADASRLALDWPDV